MSVPDFFNASAFSMVSLTAAVRKAPYVPGLLGRMGIFDTKPIDTDTVVIDFENDSLSILTSTHRGGPAQQGARAERKSAAFQVPRFILEKEIPAADLIGRRRLGSENQTELLTERVAKEINRQRLAHETTLEYMRCGAIKGVIADAAGTIHDVYSTLGISAPSAVDLQVDDDAVAIGAALVAIAQDMRDAVGNIEIEIHALCGRDFWRLFTNHPEVMYAFQYWQDGEFLRTDPRAGFSYKGITFHEYRGVIGSKTFIPNQDCRFFPVPISPGTELYQTAYAPADYIETVGTLGEPVYARQEAVNMGRGMRVQTQSASLPICTRPEALFRGYY